MALTWIISMRHLALFLLLLFFPFSSLWFGVEAAGDVADVSTTKELRNALYSPSITRIRLTNSIRIDSGEWGWARPDITREVLIETLAASGGELELNLSGHKSFVRILPGGNVTFSSLTIKGGLKTGDGAVVSILPFFSIAKGGTMRLSKASVDLGRYLCTVLPLNMEDTMGEILNAFLPEIQCEGMASTPEFALFPNCDLPNTFFMDESRNDDVGRVEMREMRLYCAGDNDAGSVRTQDIVISTSDPAEMAFALTRALDFTSVFVDITVNGRVELSANGWDDSIVFGEFRKYTVVFRGGSSSGADRLVSYDNPKGYIIGVNAVAHIMTENMILENPKFLPGLNSKLRTTPNVCDTDAYIMKWPVYLPSMFGGSGLELTMTNTTIIYNHCPTNFSFKSFCESLNSLEQQEDILLEDLDVECNSPDTNRLRFSRLTIALPSFLRNGGFWMFHNFKLENVDVVCEAFDFQVDQIPMCSREVVGVSTSNNSPPPEERSPPGEPECDGCASSNDGAQSRHAVWAISGFLVMCIVAG
ncbi:hypothetical protein BSKO_10318 [Bryopsis sp. KO-2023]|nr:hypothetical protein BSKO_10318 [Bryopsis sp. KO-2023]